MKIETIRKNYWKGIAIGLGVFVLVLVVLITNGTFAKYSASQSVPLTRGVVNYKAYDFKIMAMYQENDSGGYDEVEVMPSGDYVINEDKSYCYTTSTSVRDSNAELKTVEGNHVFNNLDKSSKCYVWFDEYVNPYTARDTILAGKTISTRSSFGLVTESSTGTMYSAADDDGTSYYFAGAATDNYVYFAGYYWRIIRINGDGTIRMIYDGTTARANGITSEDARIGTSAFNSSYADNASVGFMYGASSTSYAATHANTFDSTIKDALDTWYTNNLKSYASYIDANAGFCGDRTSTTSSSGAPDGTGGYGTTETYYGAYYRLNTNKTPSLKCTNSNDLYTVSGASKGNKALSNPIGLISADEVSYAGGLMSADNKSYYLYTGGNNWTMSPYYYGGSFANVFYVGSYLSASYVYYTYYGVCPVINLKADVTFTGSGTSSDAYKVS